MKKHFVLLCFMFLMHGISAQSLLDIYKKGVVKLTPDTEYAQGNNWDKVFQSYSDSMPTIPNQSKVWIGDRKSIVMMPDGSIVVNHFNRSMYSLFDANGKFVKEFGIKNSSGKALQKNQSILGIVNNNFFTRPDNMGKGVLTDFNGNYVKTLNFDYTVHNMIPLNNNKIAVVAWVNWSDRHRDFVAIVDCQTNEEKIIWDHFTLYNRRDADSPGTSGHSGVSIKLEKNSRNADSSDMRIIEYIDKINAKPYIAFTNKQLVVALPHNGEILFYDVNGTLKSKQKADWQQKYRSVEEQKESIRKSIERLTQNKKKIEESGKEDKKRLQMVNAMIQSYEASLKKIKDPLPLPMFANIIKDSDGNLLFFEVPEKDGANQFNVWVYQNGGKFVAKSSFVCDDFDLSITPSKMIFHNGYIYGLQTLKNTSGNPLRLVRFKLSN